MHYMLGFGLNSRVSLFLALFSLLEWVLLLCSAWKAGLLLDDRQFNDFLAANSPGRLHRRGKVKLGLASLLVWEFRMGKSQCRSTAVAMLLKLYTRSALLMLMRVALVTQPLDHRQNNNNYFMNHVEWNDKNEIFIYLKNKTNKTKKAFSLRPRYVFWQDFANLAQQYMTQLCYHCSALIPLLSFDTAAQLCYRCSALLSLVNFANAVQLCYRCSALLLLLSSARQSWGQGKARQSKAERYWALLNVAQ